MITDVFNLSVSALHLNGKKKNFQLKSASDDPEGLRSEHSQSCAGSEAMIPLVKGIFSSTPEKDVTVSLEEKFRVSFSLPGIAGDLSLPWRREWQPTPVFLPGEFHEQRSLAVYSPWGLKESDTTEWLTPL